MRNCASKMDEQKLYLFNNISLGLMEASHSATQKIGRYVVHDAKDLSYCGRGMNTVLLGNSVTSFKN
jgi:hypothetical protein